MTMKQLGVEARADGAVFAHVGRTVSVAAAALHSGPAWPPHGAVVELEGRQPRGAGQERLQGRGSPRRQSHLQGRRPRGVRQSHLQGRGSL